VKDIVGKGFHDANEGCHYHLVIGRAEKEELLQRCSYSLLTS
jgi:hypothetical protein